MADTKHPAEALADTIERRQFLRSPLPEQIWEMLRRIPALEADLEAARAQRDKFMERDASACARAEAAEAERDQLHSEGEALRADAERMSRVNIELRQALTKISLYRAYNGDTWAADVAQEAIDAARKQQ